MHANVDGLCRYEGTGTFRKETHFRGEISAIDVANGEALVSARFYGSPTGAAAYACVWILAEPFYGHGGGRATGYGFHRPSAALQVAIARAGIRLSEDIDGRGEDAMRDAVRAIAEAVANGRQFVIHNAHP